MIATEWEKWGSEFIEQVGKEKKKRKKIDKNIILNDVSHPFLPYNTHVGNETGEIKGLSTRTKACKTKQAS